MRGSYATKFIDSTGNVFGPINNAGAPQICSQDYLQAVAEGDIAGHTPWAKIGFSPYLAANTESDLWSYGGTINFATSSLQMEVSSSNNVDDVGKVIKNGTATGGTTTTLIDAGANFLAATAVDVGDCVLLDTTKEYGYVTGVSTTALTCSGGFSLGGSGSLQAYRVVDKSNYLGAQVVRIEYLDSNYNTQYEFVALSGTNVVSTVSTDMLRINSFKVIAAGSNAKPTGNLLLRGTAGHGAKYYSYITAGYTRARNIAYTVPNNKTLYIVSITYGWGYEVDNKTEFCRLYTRATLNDGFKTPGIFFPFTEVICANTSQFVDLLLPTKIPSKVDIKVSAISTNAGHATVALRGWLE